MQVPFLKFLLIIVFLQVCVSGFAQVPDKKQNYGKIRKESSVNETDALLEQAGRLKESNPQRALDLVKDALAMSMVREDVVAESRCYNLLGEINMGVEEWKLALENFSVAYQNLAAKNHENHPERIKALSGLAKTNLKLANYQQALSYLGELRALRIDRATLVECELDISEVHYQMQHYDEALTAVNRIQQTGKAIDGRLQARIENQKAKIFARTNQVEESYKRLQSSQNILRSTPAAKPKSEEAELRSAKEELSDVLHEQKRYDEKIDLLNSSIDYNTDVSNFGEVAKDKVELGNTLIAKGETSAALRQLEEAALIADTIGDPKKQAVAFLSLAELHDSYGNTRDAIRNYKKYSQAVATNESASEQRLIEKSELIKTQRDIEELSKFITVTRQEEKLSQAMVFRQKLIIYGLVLIILIIAVTSYFIYRSAQASKTANQLLALKSLRSQMNPHFIFNALNSVNHFVSQNDERAANRFLSEFSRLMRLVMENSQEDFISLQKEEEIISLYLKLEHYRFRDKFDYEIIFDECINKESIQIPPMLIQPYIENAVWHGLRYKDSKGFLSVRVDQQDVFIHVEITDNGIGRKRSAELKTENQRKQESTGLKNIRERLGIINKVYRTNFRVTTEDLSEESGTKVNLYVPLKENADGKA